MPYASQVRVSALSGAAPSLDVRLALWELWTSVDSASRVRNEQADQDETTVAVAGGTPTDFSFVRGPSFLSNRNHSIALAAYQGGMPGPVFRSGRMETLPPGAPGDPAGLVDVMLLEQQRFTMQDVNAQIPVPITLPDGNTVTAASVTSSPPSRTLRLVASGPYGATTFTYTLDFTIDPSDDQTDLSSVLAATAVGRGTLTFAAGPGGGFQAFWDNLFAGLFVGSITTSVVSFVTRTLNSAAAGAAAAAAGAAGATGGLPAGVVLGVRAVGVAPGGDLVIGPAVGCFGSLVARFAAMNPAPPPPPPRPPQRRPCFIATAAAGADSPQVVTLRAYRDLRLRRSATGRALVRAYERVSPPVARVVARSGALRALVRGVVVGPLSRFAAWRLGPGRSGGRPDPSASRRR